VIDCVFVCSIWLLFVLVLMCVVLWFCFCCCFYQSTDSTWVPAVVRETATVIYKVQSAYSICAVVLHVVFRIAWSGVDVKLDVLK